MNADLLTLRKWAATRADTDPDEAARPLWWQIRDEVGQYLDDGPEPITGDQPLFPNP